VARIGILGGTFNPPHLGHLALARHAREALGLDRAVLMPAYESPLKSVAQDPGAEHRLHMSRLLVDDSPGLSACAHEIERGGKSYTVDTLRAIHASHPDAELTLIVGADTAATLPAWREPGRLLELADLAVAAREGSARSQVLGALDSLQAAQDSGAAGAGGNGDEQRSSAGIHFLDMPVLDISSSMARERAAAGEPIDDLVGPDVAAYIAEHGLYSAERERAG
jgi:nicotinate-nucleotide adenylyltransferase